MKWKGKLKNEIEKREEREKEKKGEKKKEREIQLPSHLRQFTDFRYFSLFGFSDKRNQK